MSAPAEEHYNPFFNVRVGGPKEKRIRRVELMGEHKPKPLYYIKVSQDVANEYLSIDVLKSSFEKEVGNIGDIYRPQGADKEPKEFVLIGFFDPNHVSHAVQLSANGVCEVDGVRIAISEAKTWLLDLYPKVN